MTWESSAISLDQLAALGAATQCKTMDDKTHVSPSSQIEGDDESVTVTVEHEDSTESHAVFWDIENVYPINLNPMSVLGPMLMGSYPSDSMTLAGTFPNLITS